MIPRVLLLLVFALALAGCAWEAPKARPGKKIVLETVDHGPMRPKTYLYREVDYR